MLPTFESQNRDTVEEKDKKTEIQVGIAKGDSVYIRSGPKKGTIAEVMAYVPDSDCVMLSNSTEKRVLPKSKWPEGNTSHVVEFPKLTPRSEVWLAGKEKDENGKINYVVAKEIEFGEQYYDDKYRKWIPRRYIKHHSNIEIPWPNPPNAFEDGELSTPEHIVHEKTYELQTIGKSPFPTAALDQLRNPYSPFKRQKVTQFHLHRLAAPEMPLTKEQKIYLAKKQKDENKAQKRITPLSEEVKLFIGEKMAAHMNKIESEHLRMHLEALSKVKIPDFEKTLEAAKEAETITQEQEIVNTTETTNQVEKSQAAPEASQ